MEKEINYQAIDLGLPSGLLWANKNIGATSEKDPGLFFQYGDTVGHSIKELTSKKPLNKDNFEYKFWNGKKITKYIDKEKEMTLEPEDDAAMAIMGNGWRTPTIWEIIELLNNTDKFIITKKREEIEATVDNTYYFRLRYCKGVKETIGMKFYNRNDHSKYIFIPGVSSISNQTHRFYKDGEIKLWSSSSSRLAGSRHSHCLSIFGKIGCEQPAGIDWKNEYIPIRGVKKI